MKGIESLLGALAVPADKLSHFVVSQWAALLVIVWAWLCGVDTLTASILAMGVVSVLAWGKEAYDHQHPEAHTEDFGDLVWSVLGGLFAVGCVSLGRHML